MLEPSQLYDPELIARLSGRELPGPPSPFPHRGAHGSTRRGASLEFSEHTEYVAGDDLRHLDWKVLGKTDRLFVKRYEDERLQRVVLLVDASNSMRYGAANGSLVGSKYHLAARIAVAIATCLQRQGDAVGVGFAGGRFPQELPPKSGPAQMGAVLEVLGHCVPDGAAALTERCRTAAEALRRAAAVYLFSDFLDEGAEELPGVRWLRARGIAVRTVQVLHADEIWLPFENTARFVNLEGPDALVADPVPLRKAYHQEMREFIAQVARRAGALGVPHALCNTAEDPAPALVRMLGRLKRE